MNNDKKEEIRKRLKALREDVKSLFVENADGDQFWDNNKAIDLRSDIDEVLAILMEDMENRGMLTYKAEDPKLAMGRFSD